MNAIINVDAQQGQLTTVDPMQLLSQAIAKGVDVDQLGKLMDLQERWDAKNAEKAFVVAMAEFKKDPPKIVKDIRVRFETQRGTTTEYMHAGLGQVASVIGKALSAVGISHRFETIQENSVIMVTCILTHSMGHSEKTQLSGPPDASGGKNGIQGIGSTVTYLQRYTLLSAVGLASDEDDDDGQSQTELITDKQFDELSKALAEVGRTASALCKNYKIPTLKLMPAAIFNDALALVKNQAKKVQK